MRDSPHRPGIVPVRVCLHVDPHCSQPSAVEPGQDLIREESREMQINHPAAKSCLSSESTTFFADLTADSSSGTPSCAQDPQ
jgi:hypothetical protein